MNGREYFHESVVRDVVDILTSLKDYDEVQFLKNSGSNRSFKSITSATKDLILTFPVLASTDADPNNVCMIAKAHEKKCATLLHMLFTAICVNSNEDVFDFVKKFHTNVGSMDGTLEKYADSIDQLASAYGEAVEYNIDRDVLNSVLEELRESNYTLPDDIKETGIDEYAIIPSSMSRDGKCRVVHEAPNDLIRAGLDINRSMESGNKVLTNAIMSQEYKKANELMPTLMVVNFIEKGQTTNTKAVVSAVVGVKAKVYPVNSMDICNRITSKLEDKNVLNSFIRATTNEIGFFRDFLFAIDKAKTDAISYSKSATSNKLWKVLERRSTKSKFRRSLKMTNDATAITTLVLTDNDIEYMKKEKSVDILNVSNARKILDSYNFMCICAMNEATETASFLYDTGDDNYEKLTFSNLEREASDSSYKKMVNLLTKVNR